MASNQEEEVLGKAYDGRLMRRLLTYLRPYKWHVVAAVASIILKSGLDVLGPFLTMIAIDKYLAKSPNSHSWIGDRLSSTPLTGIAEIGALYVGILVFTFGLEFVQTYLMQWTGQKVMFDLRRQIFRHLQHMHVGFFDKNPVGRLVTRVTTDVDALNEMFTAGVVSIFEDVFVLAGIIGIMMHTNWRLALITFAALPLIVYATRVFRDKVRDSYRRIRTAIARINSYLQEAVSGMLVLQLFNREKRAFHKFSDINASHMEAYKDAIMAYSVYYPVVEILSSLAIASIIWFGGGEVIRGMATIGVLVAFIQYAQRFFRPIQDLSEKYNILQSAMAAGERVFKLLDTKIEVTSPAVPKQVTGPGRIEFDHVWFAYGNKSAAENPADSSSRLGQVGAPVPTGAIEPDWVLRDVSFVLDALLRRAARRDSHRRRGHQGDEPGRLARPLRCCAAGPVSVQWDDCGQHPAGNGAHSGRRRGAGSGGRQPRRLHPRPARRISGGSARTRLDAFHWTETVDFVCAGLGAQSEDSDSR
jgi:ATP-binding cassette subfamily B protein